MTTDGRHPPYVKIWVALVILLIGSLGAASVGAKRTAVSLIFGLAAIKAFLVISYYMHLRFEPRWLRVLLPCVVGLIVVLFVALIPDIVHVYGR